MRSAAALAGDSGGATGSWRIRADLTGLVAVGLLSCLSCGTIPVAEGPEGTSASAPRSASPSGTAIPSGISLPDTTRFTSQNCSSTPPTTPDRALGAYYTMRLASGWTVTGNYGQTESLLLELTAPASYGYAPTRIKFLALPFEVNRDFGPQATAHSIAAHDVSTHNFGSPQSLATSVADCSVAAEPAALFGYADSNESGYRFAIVHHDRLLEIWVLGTGGVGDQTVRDATEMMGSIVWTF